MKVIHVAGLSGAGKTVFISRLVPRLRERGPVAVVKHLGHHPWDLQEGKDTTVFFESGATSVGIDSHKSVLVMEEHDLEHVLGLLDRMEMAFAVIEGFKQKPYPKITIGGLPHPENVLLEDPAVEEVLENLDRFPEFSVNSGKSPGIARSGMAARFTLKLDIPARSPEWASGRVPESILARLEREYPDLRGDLVRSGSAGEPFSVYISAPNPRVAYTGMRALLEEMEHTTQSPHIPELHED
jgi:molybdopterin-guanine dinucleotide biosynthesis protein B